MKLIPFKAHLIVFICLLFTLKMAGQSESYSFGKLTTNDGLSQGRITSILQDKSSFLWFGTIDGLNRYDGYSFLVFRHIQGDSSSISSNVINDIKETPNGNLLVATNNGLNLFNHVKQKFSRIPVLFESSFDQGFKAVSKILVPANNNKYFYYATKAGLIKFQPETGAQQLVFKLSADPSRNERSIRALLEDRNGNIWIGTGGEGLYFYNVKQNTIRLIWKSHHPTQPSKVILITNIIDDGEGRIFVADYFNICVFNLNGDRLRQLSRNTDSSPHTTMANGNIGEIYIAYLASGMAKYSYEDDKFVEVLDNSGPAPKNEYSDFISLYLDKSNTLWCGSNGRGIYFMNPYNNLFKKFTNFNPLLKSVRTMIELKDGSLLISGYTGLVNMQSDGSFKSLSDGIFSDPYNLNLAVYSMVEDIFNPGVIWLGTEGGGMYRLMYKKGGSPQISDYTESSNNLSGEFVTSLFWGSDSLLWISTERGLSSLDTKKHLFKYYNPTIGVESPISFGIIFEIIEHENSLLLCTEKNGIVKFDLKSKKFSTFLSTTTKAARLPSNDVRSIYIKDGNLFYIGSNLGLSVYNEQSGKMISYTSKNGLPNEMIYGILEDDKGKLWLSTNSGLSRFDPVTNSFANYSQSEGLQGSEFNTKAYLKLKNKNLVFGGVNGFNIVDPRIVDKTPLIPDMAITGFSLFSKVVPVGEYNGKVILDSVIHMKKVIYLDYDENSISFEFTALNFNVNSTTRYSYILEGFKDDWTVPSTERKAVYTNLSAGEYRFAVAAINRDGSRSKRVAELTIIIAPPFWRTTWFRILALIIVIGIFYSGYKFKTNSIRKRNEELEKLVENRTRQLETKKAELEQRNHELIEANASKNRFFSMFSHDLRSPFSAILGYLQILDEDFDELSKSDRTYYFQSLYTVSRNLFSTIENVFNWFRIETGRINDEPKLLMLEQSIKETVDILTANITLKKIEIIIEVEQGTRVWSDPVMLKTILQNLISNAIKFSEEEGIISISSNTKDGMVAISVSDSGRGMSEDELNKLFDKKVIFTTEGTQQEKGSGLGLLICKEFVEKCGGTITVTSSHDDGTSFTFTLPNTPRTN